MQNKQWALGSGFVKGDFLVVLLWTAKKKKSILFGVLDLIFALMSWKT
jgi:hypothetical protein